MRKYLNLKEARQDRHAKLWTVIKFSVAYDRLVNCENFYEYKQSVADFNEARDKLANSSIQEDLFGTVFRFFRMKYYMEECDHNLSEEEQLLIINWKRIEIDYSKIVSNVATAYKTYWDSVLASYKRTSSRDNRIRYLIQKLEEFAEWPELKAIHGAVDEIHALRKHYAEMVL